MRKNRKRSRSIVYVVCGLIVMSVVCTGAAYDAAGTDAKITEINEFEGTAETVDVKAKSGVIEDIFLENEIEIGIHDKINFDDAYEVKNGDEIIIKRGKVLTVEIDDTLVTTSATTPNVGEALEESGFELDENDYAIPDVSENISDNQVIKIIRVDDKTETKVETLPYSTVYKEDSGLYEGETKVITQGVNGKVRITENVITENGEEISREEISRVTEIEKVDKVVAKGTKKKPVATPKPTPDASPQSTPTAKTKTAEKATTAKTTADSTGGTSDKGFSYSKKMTMNATAYSAFKKDGSYGITASGMTAKYGVVAVDPKVIPLGTKLYIEGYGYAVAGDTGGAIKGNKIDLCFEKPNKDLYVFGRKNVTVYILN